MQIDAKDIWKIFIEHIKDQKSLFAKNVIWDLCNDFIQHFPELEREQELQKKFVKLYDESV